MAFESSWTCTIIASTPMDSTQSALLLALGLAPGKVANICRDPDALARVMQLVDAGGLGKTSSLLPHQTGLVASLALNGGSIDAGQRSYILRYVLEDEMASQIQLTGRIWLNSRVLKFNSFFVFDRSNQLLQEGRRPRGRGCVPGCVWCRYFTPRLRNLLLIRSHRN